MPVIVGRRDAPRDRGFTIDVSGPRGSSWPRRARPRHRTVHADAERPPVRQPLLLRDPGPEPDVEEHVRRPGPSSVGTSTSSPGPETRGSTASATGSSTTGTSPHPRRGDVPRVATEVPFALAGRPLNGRSLILQARPRLRVQRLDLDPDPGGARRPRTPAPWGGNVLAGSHRSGRLSRSVEASRSARRWRAGGPLGARFDGGDVGQARQEQLLGSRPRASVQHFGPSSGRVAPPPAR